MFEVIVDQPRPRSLRVAPEVLAALAETARSVGVSSALVWAEHCTECAMPACYSNCALYTPRADLSCRRFTDGIVPVTVAGEQDVSPLTGGMRIGFRQWGKLEAFGRVEMRSSSWRQRRSSADDMVRSALRSGLPYAVRRRAGRVWPRVTTALTPSGTAPQPRDVFLIECINEGGAPVPLTLTILDDDSTSRFFQHGFVLTPGYNRVLVQASAISARVDVTRQLLIRIEPTAVPPGNSFVFTRVDWVRPVALLEPAGGLEPALPRSARLPVPVPTADAGCAPKVKCVVWDLDDTVWLGTLVEDDPEALVPRQEVVEIIHALDARGILQSVASKNDPDEALRVLERHGLSDYLLHPQIGWGPKSQSVERIASLLDIGVDTLLFIDDQPFERAEVQAAQPAVRVVDSELLATVLERDDLDVPVTAESGRRRLLYREESHRREALQQAPSDFDDFLRSCDIRLHLTPPTAATAERIYELGQRTNQLNYSGERLDRSDVDALVGGEAPRRASP